MEVPSPTLSPAAPSPALSPVASTPAPATPALPAKPGEQELWSTAWSIYSRTRSTIIKRELPPERRRRDSNGEPIAAHPFTKDLFELEALTLKALSSKTNIKIPRVIDSGLDENGLGFVETELWDGIPGPRVKEKCRMPDGEKHIDTGECPRCDEKALANAESYLANMVAPVFRKKPWDGIPGPCIKKECQMPDGARHVDTGECTICESKARADAQSYIVNIVLPELNRLTPNTIGPAGKIIAPPGVRDHGNRWICKTEAGIGCGTANIMFELGTLDVIGIYDWECCLNFTVSHLINLVDA